VTAHQIAYRQWTGREFEDGALNGAAVADDGLVIASPVGIRIYSDPREDRPAVDYEFATWSSPETPVPFGAAEVVPSWNAVTPAGTWIEVALEIASGPDRRMYVLGQWAESTDDIQRTTVPSPSDRVAVVDFDVLKAAAGRSISSWHLHVTLLRRRGSDATPTLSLAGAVASAPDQTDQGAPSQPGPPSEPESAPPAWGVELDVPSYSQALHRGEYPEYSGGGEAWCSPVSTAMVMAFHGKGPGPADYAWVESACGQPWIDHAAASIYDPAYRGAGNWSFNVAYAARFGLIAFVTRLRGMADLEAFVAAGLPLVASVTFTEEELTGAGYGTAGHLFVVCGLTPEGDVVVNDPASHQIASDDEVRTVYRRREFERAWLDGSGGIVYVLHPPGHRLPDRPEGEPARW
jgi:peptidase C39-like protein